MMGLILAGDVREEVYTVQLHMLDKVLAACERAETDTLPPGTAPTGMLPWVKFEKTMRSVMPLKRDDLLEEVLQSAREQQPNGYAVEKKGEVETIRYHSCCATLSASHSIALSFRYTMLFEEDREFNQGPFAEALRDQYVGERDDWLQDLHDAVCGILADANPEHAAADCISPDVAPLSAADYRRAILSFDSGKPSKEVERCVCVPARVGWMGRRSQVTVLMLGCCISGI
jgi:hypothetical protein